MSMVYVGLGSNLGDSRQHLLDAFAALDRLPRSRLLRRSRLYRTPPWGVLEQPPFVNAVAELDSALSPLELLQAMLAIEQSAGRVRDGTRWGPRVLDLDLLHIEGVRQDSAELTLPHPRIAERAFVLSPLSELVPDLNIYGQGRVAALLAAVDSSACTVLS